MEENLTLVNSSAEKTMSALKLTLLNEKKIRVMPSLKKANDEELMRTIYSYGKYLQDKCNSSCKKTSNNEFGACKMYGSKNLCNLSLPAVKDPANLPKKMEKELKSEFIDKVIGVGVGYASFIKQYDDAMKCGDKYCKIAKKKESDIKYRRNYVMKDIELKEILPEKIKIASTYICALNKSAVQSGEGTYWSPKPQKQPISCTFVKSVHDLEKDFNCIETKKNPFKSESNNDWIHAGCLFKDTKYAGKLVTGRSESYTELYGQEVRGKGVIVMYDPYNIDKYRNESDFDKDLALRTEYYVPAQERMKKTGVVRDKNYVTLRA